MRRAALVIAHPGHELRIHAWLGRARPLVCVLTDGSGASGAARIEQTRRLVQAAGAAVGPVFGAVSEPEVSAALLACDVTFFTEIARCLAAAFERERVELVVADAAEGHHPVHDLAASIADAAAAACPWPVERLEYAVVGASGSGEPRLRVELDAGEAALKLEAARGYPELADEVERAVAAFGLESFLVETLHASRAAEADDLSPPPYYEAHGEQQVARGVFREVIRRAEHVLPVQRALADLLARRR